ncbi:hypothetical protein FHS43_000373 [Streptosporangium becharense]|uniref:Uncharacterized protein n=1 Tax=Streptosporangium becharense TaxID=1816182 RepID=A0A7W9MGW6_9ACTN|nr:hypothetical protein [Streptosporangium becharense]MBB2909127.1 hypothetical protein [Streptosporangium becharense]MBB5819854.1 hypothetical protein [Streptosporangium becharense]
MTLALAVEKDTLIVDVPEHPPVRLPLVGEGRASKLLIFGYPGRGRMRYGLAVLDESGLVMLEAPGSRSRRAVEAFAQESGLAFEFRAFDTPQGARIALARRSPSWRAVSWRRAPAPLPRLRVPGVRSLRPPVGSPKVWWREQLLYILLWAVLAYGVVFAALVVLNLTDPGADVTRWMGPLGVVALVLAGVTVVGAVVLAGIGRRRTRNQTAQGRELQRAGEPHCRLVVVHGRLLLETARRTRELKASELLLYSTEAGTTGLVVGGGLFHLPGPWDPEEVARFADRNDLRLEVRSLARDEYLALTGQVKDAVP